MSSWLIIRIHSDDMITQWLEVNRHLRNVDGTKQKRGSIMLQNLLFVGHENIVRFFTRLADVYETVVLFLNNVDYKHEVEFNSDGEETEPSDFCFIDDFAQAVALLPITEVRVEDGCQKARSTTNL
jgi:hypothetical protein